MIHLEQAIVVEGRYDKNTLSQIVDAPIFETRGFGIMKDKKLLAFLREHMAKCPDCLQPGAEYTTDLKRLIRLCDYFENATAVLGGENGGKRSFEGCATEHHDKDSSIRRTDPTGAPSEESIS